MKYLKNAIEIFLEKVESKARQRAELEVEKGTYSVDNTEINIEDLIEKLQKNPGLYIKRGTIQKVVDDLTVEALMQKHIEHIISELLRKRG